MAKRGRPTIYTQELADEICRRLSDGQSLREICRDKDMPDESTVRAWAVFDRDGFYPQYAKAREAQLERWADEIVEIADNGSNDWMARQGVQVANSDHINRSRLRIDTRKWLMSKLAPKKYGDKLAIGGDGGEAIKVQTIVTGVPRAGED